MESLCGMKGLIIKTPVLLLTCITNLVNYINTRCFFASMVAIIMEDN